MSLSGKIWRADIGDPDLGRAQPLGPHPGPVRIDPVPHGHRGTSHVTATPSKDDPGSHDQPVRNLRHTAMSSQRYSRTGVTGAPCGVVVRRAAQGRIRPDRHRSQPLLRRPRQRLARRAPDVDKNGCCPPRTPPHGSRRRRPTATRYRPAGSPEPRRCSWPTIRGTSAARTGPVYGPPGSTAPVDPVSQRCGRPRGGVADSAGVSPCPSPAATTGGPGGTLRRRNDSDGATREEDCHHDR